MTHTNEPNPADHDVVRVRDRSRPDGSPAVVDIPPPAPTIDELAVMTANAAAGVAAGMVKFGATSLRLAGASARWIATTPPGTSLRRTADRVLAPVSDRGRDEMADLAGRVQELVSSIVAAVVPAVMAAVDVDAIVRRIDPDAIVERVDVDTLLERVDVDALLDRVDVDRLLERVDIEQLVARAGIADIVAQSTSHMADSTIDLARRQAAGLDAVVMRLVDRTLRRSPGSVPDGPEALVDMATDE